MKAYVFPGQGSQKPGMAKELYEGSSQAKAMFDEANDLLGFRITDIMFDGTEDDLKETKVTQPAIFLHSVALAATTPGFAPDMVAGHSLGEFSSLVANQALSFQDGLQLVAQRAAAMQKACELQPSTMAAVLGLSDEQVEAVCQSIDDIVVPANYNNPGQLVISGTVSGIDTAVEALKAAGAKKVVVLKVGGAFHSPLMEPAREELQVAIENTTFSQPICPVYQNVSAMAATDIEQIKKNLVMQLTAPVRWTQSVQNMMANGAAEFIECGPGKALQGMIKKVDRKMPVSGLG